MKLLLLLTWPLVSFTMYLTNGQTTIDSIPPGRASRVGQSPYQPPPPVIMPGTYLDTAFRAIGQQDLAVRQAAPAWLRARTKGQPIYVLDGNVATVSQIRRLKQTDVASITVLNGEKATALYGPNAKPGLLIITTKARL